MTESKFLQYSHHFQNLTFDLKQCTDVFKILFKTVKEYKDIQLQREGDY